METRTKIRKGGFELVQIHLMSPLVTGENNAICVVRLLSPLGMVEKLRPASYSQPMTRILLLYQKKSPNQSVERDTGRVPLPLQSDEAFERSLITPCFVLPRGLFSTGLAHFLTSFLIFGPGFPYTKFLSSTPYVRCGVSVLPERGQKARWQGRRKLRPTSSVRLLTIPFFLAHSVSFRPSGRDSDSNAVRRKGWRNLLMETRTRTWKEGNFGSKSI
jgi:hypothetical protein